MKNKIAILIFALTLVIVGCQEAGQCTEECISIQDTTLVEEVDTTSSISVDTTQINDTVK